jgi:hypothetical protein
MSKNFYLRQLLTNVHSAFNQAMANKLGRLSLDLDEMTRLLVNPEQ